MDTTSTPASGAAAPTTGLPSAGLPSAGLPLAGLPLAGLTVLVTGAIDGLTRDQARTAITTLGGTPAPGVSAKVNLVVLGDGAGVSKTAKAEALNIPVLDGPTFAALHADPTTWDGQPLGMTMAEYDRLHGDPDDDNERRPATADERAHWVARGTNYIWHPDGTRERQVRFMCACGHHWMTDQLHAPTTCPRPENPVTTPPWL